MDQTKGRMADIEPVRLGPKSRFRFRCHKDVSCFTRCCRGINIALTPYDIIRMKNRLGLSSTEFLAMYTTPQLLEKTGLPVVTLKLLEDDPEKSCPFVRDEGCLIYEDRPTSCRYYPLGVAALSHKEGADDKDFFFFVHEEHCKGFDEDAEWTVSDWRADQGVDAYDDVNAGWTDLMVRKRSFPNSIQLTEKSKQLFFMASYDIDAFRRFVFESDFLNRVDVPEETVAKMREDEVALLEFGMGWLKDLFFDYRRFDPDFEGQTVKLKDNG
jgi:Fe-S-cluster containining protein